jgi:hypothetical protein
MLCVCETGVIYLVVVVLVVMIIILHKWPNREPAILLAANAMRTATAA